MAAIPADLDATRTPRLRVFGPHGRPMTSMVTRGWQSSDIRVLKDGSINSAGGSDYPQMEPYTGLHGAAILSDYDGNEFLETHCRVVEVYDDYDESDFETTPAIEPWPDDIVEACVTICILEDAGQAFDEARKRAPAYLDDTQRQVLDHVIFGKFEGLANQAEAKIVAFRKGRVEVTALKDPDEEITDA